MEKEIVFRPANSNDAHAIWKILAQAIIRRKNDGSQQWQDGYPNSETVDTDIDNQWGFVLQVGDEVAVYAALIKNFEPAYEEIKGQWISHQDFLVVHRVAVSESFLGKGLVKVLFQQIEAYAVSQGIFSIKMDTNFDNLPMLKIAEKLGYVYCGKVYFRGGERLAFEKFIGG